MNYVIDFLKGLAYGAMVMIFAAFILFALANLVFGEDAVPVREATLGETNRSLNYTVDDATRDSANAMEVEVTVTVEHFTTPPAPTCAQINGRLEFIRQRIVKYQQRTPKYAAAYQSALDEIKAAWCHNDD